MKAWYISDRKGYCDYAIIVFAETRGKAIYSAIGTEEFEKYEWSFTELRAIRKPAFDKYYRNSWRMDWCNAEDRIAMIKEGFCCDDDSFDPDECELCEGKEYCTRYEEYLEEEKENASIAGLPLFDDE